MKTDNIKRKTIYITNEKKTKTEYGLRWLLNEAVYGNCDNCYYFSSSIFSLREACTKLSSMLDKEELAHTDELHRIFVERPDKTTTTIILRTAYDKEALTGALINRAVIDDYNDWDKNNQMDDGMLERIMIAMLGSDNSECRLFINDSSCVRHAKTGDDILYIDKDGNTLKTFSSEGWKLTSLVNEKEKDRLQSELKRVWANRQRTNCIRLFGLNKSSARVVYSLAWGPSEHNTYHLQITNTVFETVFDQSFDEEFFNTKEELDKRLEDLILEKLRNGYSDYSSKFPEFKHEYIKCSDRENEELLYIIEVWPNGSWEIIARFNCYHSMWYKLSECCYKMLMDDLNKENKSE